MMIVLPSVGLRIRLSSYVPSVELIEADDKFDYQTSVHFYKGKYKQLSLLCVRACVRACVCVCVCLQHFRFYENNKNEYAFPFFL